MNCLLLIGGGVLLEQEFYRAFLKRFGTSFARTIKDSLFDGDDTKYYELLSEKEIDFKALLASGNEVSYKDICNELSEEQVQRCEGKETLICCDCHNFYSIYKLHAVDGQPLPEPEETERDKCRTYDAINFIWKLLQAQYDQENGIKKKQKIDTKKEICIQSNQQAPTGLVTSIKTAPEIYSAVLVQLDAQPLSVHQNHICAMHKVLPLESWYDCKIIKVLCENAKSKIGKRCYINDFGPGKFLDATGKNIEQGIIENIYANMGLKASLQELKIAFDTLIDELTAGWQQATLVENPDIVYTQSEEEWYLFLKPKVMVKEHNLINWFAISFGLTDKVSCHNCFQHSAGNDQEYRNVLYLWIKKKSYHEVAQAFDLNPTMIMQ